MLTSTIENLNLAMERIPRVTSFAVIAPPAAFAITRLNTQTRPELTAAGSALVALALFRHINQPSATPQLLSGVPNRYRINLK
jgi:hypothetical protein